MLDIKFIRENPDKVKEGIRKKQVKVDIDHILELDEKRRESIKQAEELRVALNKISQRGIDDEERENARKLKVKVKAAELIVNEKEEEIEELMRQIPNLPLEDVPEGKDGSENPVLKEEGKKPKFDFKPKDYLELSENLDLIDVKRAAKVSGTRFGYLKNQAALLEFALVRFAFDTLTKEGFIPIIPPVMLNYKAMSAMGYLDRGADEVYHLKKDDLYLVGTSEQPVGAMHMGEVLKEEELPKRYVGFSSCFRREAGAYGKDTKGILRVHQFDKVEMFSFCHPDKSREEHQFLLSLQEKLMKELKLPYQVIQLCTGDLGSPSAATYDIETWFPSQNRYRETHSTSNCTDFQARRLNVRFKGKEGTDFVHTLNGTAFAIGRTLIAIIENYQQEDGSIEVPKVLRDYLDFKKIKSHEKS